MSRVNYRFVTDSSTSWSQSVTCDLCHACVERVGALPTREGEAMPEYQPNALAGWASFSMRIAKPPAEQPDLPQDLWPRLDRDLCPSCARVVNDWLLEIGCEVSVDEERYLDALGRPCAAPARASFGPGVELCTQLIDQLVCRRHRGHVGKCNSEWPEWRAKNMSGCPVCFDAHRVVFTQQELESHAVEKHEVRPSTSPVGWYCGNAFTRVFYADVLTALYAEHRDQERERARFFPNPGWTI